VSQSFTDVAVPIPPGTTINPMVMAAGDVLFFHGQTVHGSFPNCSRDRFRRSLIGHYLTGDATHVARFYHPIYRMDGSVVELDTSDGGSHCGVWVDRDGQPGFELVPAHEGMRAEITE